ncbi:MAG: AI-2E family transporter [Hydrogenophilus thermoluteolus]
MAQEREPRRERTGQLPLPLFVIAALVVIGAGVQAVASWLAPLLVAVFLAMISVPPLVWLHRRKVPWGLGIVLLFVVVGFAVFQLFNVLELTARQLAANGPEYQSKWLSFYSGVQAWLAARGAPWESLLAELPTPSLAVIAQGARTLAAATGQVTANFALVLLAYVFLLLEVPTLTARFTAAFPRERRAQVRMRRFLAAVNRYLVIKTSVSAATGLLAWGLLAWRGVDFALFFGVLAGLLNFIPTIGSIIAALPAVVLALLQYGLIDAAVVAVGYLAINVVLGNVVEPRWMGQALGLSPTVVLVSLLLWGWLLGTVGAFLSIPLTMIAKLALESHPSTRGWAVLMGGAVHSGGKRTPG